MGKRILSVLLAALMALLLFGCAAPAAEPAEPEAPVEAPAETPAPAPEPTPEPAPSEAPAQESAEEPAAEEEAVDPNMPKIITLDSGVRIQRTPYASSKRSSIVNQQVWNNTMLNADNRGCNVCHRLQDVVVSTGHNLFDVGYVEELPYLSCIACHKGDYGKTMRDQFHGIHNFSETFEAMGGTCESCHYIAEDGEYQIWDLVKYDVMYGITDIPADAVKAEITWNQDEISPSKT